MDSVFYGFMKDNASVMVTFPRIRVKHLQQARKKGCENRVKELRNFLNE